MWALAGVLIFLELVLTFLSMLGDSWHHKFTKGLISENDETN